MDWNDVLAAFLGLVGKRIALTLSVGDQLLAATIYGELVAAPEIKADDFYVYVDTGSGVRVRKSGFTSATWVDGPLGRELAVGFGDIVLSIKEVPAQS